MSASTRLLEKLREERADLMAWARLWVTGMRFPVFVLPNPKASVS